MAKKQRPSLFCEWVVGTTIESALGPIPKKPTKPKKRDVVRVEVTTDDESEEDTIKITYPRTGRSPPATQEPTTEEAKAVVKKVRFEGYPIKSALKKSYTAVESSDEEPESDSSQSDNVSSSDASDSDAEDSDSAPSPRKKKKKKIKQKPVMGDTESDWDSDPDPTCKKKSKDSTSPSTETSDSESEEPPKPKECGKDKTKGGKKAKKPEPETDTSESGEETSESGSEKPPKEQPSKKEKSKKKGKKNAKVEESASEDETSSSEAESPKPKKKKKGSPKSDAKEDETLEESETDAEPSDSTNETEAESEPEAESKKKQKQKNKGKVKAKAGSPKGEDEKKEAKEEQKGNKQKNKGKQKAGKQAKKASDQPEDKAEDEEAGEASNQENQGKFKQARGKRTKEGDKENAAPKGMVLKNSRYHNGFFKGNYPEGLLFPHPRGPLIEPIRAQVVQMERVIKAPSGPVPNAYYDSENNLMRQFQGLPSLNSHGQLHPAHNAFSGPPPTRQAPMPQSPPYYGFNQPQPQPGYGQYPPYQPYYQPMPPQGGYSHVPITQGMPGHAWPAVSGPQGFPPALPMGPGVQANPQVMGGTENAAPPPSKDKDKTSQNNVVPPGLTGQNNPYLPQRAGSVFKNYGSHGARTASKGDAAGSGRAGSNNWNNNVTTWNDGNGDNQQNSQNDWNPAPDNGHNGSGQNDNTWGQNQDENQNQDGNGNNAWDNSGWDNSGQQEDNGQKWASGSNGSNGTVRKRRDDHWGNDTHLGGGYTWEEKKDTIPSTTGPAADNNVVGWDVVGSGAVEDVSPGSRKSDNGMDEAKPDNVMPGSWVETPGVPAWGDASAAVDTQGTIW